MSYKRVIPRDLFNEGSLLKCLGKLTVIAMSNPRIEVTFQDGRDDGFGIRQDPGDGSIYAAHVHIAVDGRMYPHHRPLNSRENWPLFITVGDEDFEVFDSIGELSADFRGLLKWHK